MSSYQECTNIANNEDFLKKITIEGDTIIQLNFNYISEEGIGLLNDLGNIALHEDFDFKIEIKEEYVNLIDILELVGITAVYNVNIIVNGK